MSFMSELAYDIEQMYIEGYSPKTIAAMLECPVSIVYDWLEDANVEENLNETVD
jgi:DNA-directed RNA polymerase specialized sigma24 family protein